MIQPHHRFIDRMNRCDTRSGRSSQQNDRQLQRACSRHLAVGRLPAAVLRHQYFDAMALHERTLRSFGERSAIKQVLRMGNRQRRLDTIDTSNQIVVLRRLGKRCDFLPANREQYMTRFASQSSRGRWCVIDVEPTVTGCCRPRGAAERNHWCAAVSCSVERVSRHGCRIGMRGVDEGGDFVDSQIPHQAFGATESPASRRHCLSLWIESGAGQRQRHREFGARSQRLAQLPGFSGAPQYQNVSSHVAR